MAKYYKSAFFYGFSSLFFMVIGWIDNILGFFQDFWRSFVFIIQVGGFFWMGLYLKYGEKDHKERADMQNLVTNLSFLGPAIIQFLGPLSDRLYNMRIVNLWIFSQEEYFKIVGFTLLLISLFFMIWGPVYLGEYFSLDIEIRKEHKLITGGPFRLFRHPKYFGMALYFIAYFFIFRSWIIAIITIFAYVFIIWRVNDEETLLSNEFGEEWQNYCKKTKWRLVPFIW